MRKLMTTVVGVAVLCGMTAFAQSTPSTTTGMNPNRPGFGRGEMEVIHRAIREAEHDPATVPLLTQALTDRTALLDSELNHVAQLQALVTALQGSDKTAIRTAMASAKTAGETVETNQQTFLADCKAIRQHLQTLPNQGRRQPPTSGGTPATTGN